MVRLILSIQAKYRVRVCHASIFLALRSPTDWCVSAACEARECELGPGMFGHARTGRNLCSAQQATTQ
eukprot:5032786-Pyramimonas_sp.AAC.1